MIILILNEKASLYIVLKPGSSSKLSILIDIKPNETNGIIAFFYLFSLFKKRKPKES